MHNILLAMVIISFTLSISHCVTMFLKFKGCLTRWSLLCCDVKMTALVSFIRLTFTCNVGAKSHQFVCMPTNDKSTDDSFECRLIKSIS